MPASASTASASASTMLDSIDIEIQNALAELEIEQAWDEYQEVEDFNRQIDELCEMFERLL